MLESACAGRSRDLGEFSREALDFGRGFFRGHGPAGDALFNRLDEITRRFLDDTFKFCPSCRHVLIGRPRSSASFVSRSVVVRFRHRNLSHVEANMVSHGFASWNPIDAWTPQGRWNRSAPPTRTTNAAHCAAGGTAARSRSRRPFNPSTSTIDPASVRCD